jgi:LemA protein
MMDRLPRRAGLILAGMVFAASLAGCGVNDVPRLDERVKTAWSGVLSQYQRRSDLIPALVETVKPYARQEQDALTEVTDARAKTARMQLPADILNNPEAFHQFEEYQAALGGALERLLAASGRDPELAENQSFMAEEAELRQIDNRIGVARHDYADAVRAYNAKIRTAPGRWIAAVLYPDARLKESF